MVIRSILFHIEILFAGYFFWVGLYVLFRALRHESKPENEIPPWYERLEVQGATAVILVAIYMLGIAMELVSDTPAEYIGWLRGTWWALLPAIALWFRIFLFAPSPGKTVTRIPLWKHILSLVILVAGLSFGIVNQFSDFFFTYNQIIPDANTLFGTYIIPRNFPAYYLHALYFITVAYAAGGRIIYLWWHTADSDPLKPTITSILFGSSLILAGSTLTTINYLYLDYSYPHQIGDLLASIGLMIIARHMIDYDVMLQGRYNLSDYRRNLFIAALNVAGMLIVFHLVHWLSGDTLPFITIPTLVCAAVFISSSAPFFRSLANRAFLPKWESILLDKIESIETELNTAENSSSAIAKAQTDLQAITAEAKTAQEQEQIQAEVNRIFRHNTLYKDEELVNSTLFDLAALQQAINDFAQSHHIQPSQIPTADKTELLRAFLKDQVAELQPEQEGNLTAETEQQQIEYIIIYRGYFDKRTRREIVDEIEDTIGLRLLNNSRAYTQHLNRARQRLTNQIWRKEQQIKANVQLSP